MGPVTFILQHPSHLSYWCLSPELDMEGGGQVVELQ